jgi:hypothetical protein
LLVSITTGRLNGAGAQRQLDRLDLERQPGKLWRLAMRSSCWHRIRECQQGG